METTCHPDKENGKVMETSTDSPKSLQRGSTRQVRLENAPDEMQIKEVVDHEMIEHLSSLPTVFEGKTTEKTRKFSSREQLSNNGNLRKFGSWHDVRGDNVRPLSPFLSRYSSHEILDETSAGVRIPNRKIPSPFSTRNFMSPLCSRRRRTLSESPAEALISPVITRRSQGVHPLNKRVLSCPVILSDSNERMSPLTPSSPVSSRYKFADLFVFNGAKSQTGSKVVTTCTSTGTSNDFESTDVDRLPRIQQTRSSAMLVGVHKTPNESARELFNVSPVMGQSADTIERHNNTNVQCDVSDKVQYYLHTLSLEEQVDQ